jgi:tetratricopeptide (TPR) repeat protein
MLPALPEMDEARFWSYIEATMHAATQPEQARQLADLLRALPPEQIQAFDEWFSAMVQQLYPLERLRQLLRNHHYQWGDDSWLYFICWIILQGRAVFQLALDTSPELLPLVQAQSVPAEGLDQPSWYHPRWLPGFEEGAYVAGKVYEEKTGRWLDENVYVVAELSAARRGPWHEEPEEPLENAGGEAQETRERPEASADAPTPAARAAVEAGNALLTEGFGRLVAGEEAQGTAQLEAAIVHYQQATHLDAHAAAAYQNEAILLLGLGRYEDALQAFEHVLRLRPGDPFALCRKAEALWALGRHRDALVAFDDLIQRMPRHPFAFHALYEKGQLLFETASYGDALTVCDQILRLNPDDALIHYRRGLALLQLGHRDNALEALAQALQLDPDYLPAYIEQSKLLILLGRYEDALAACDQALRLDPHDVWAQLARGRIRARLAHPEERHS